MHTQQRIIKMRPEQKLPLSAQQIEDREWMREYIKRGDAYFNLPDTLGPSIFTILYRKFFSLFK